MGRRRRSRRRLTIIPVIDGSICAPIPSKVSAVSDTDVLVECPFALGNNDAFMLTTESAHLVFRVIETRLDRHGQHELVGRFDRGVTSDHRPVQVTPQAVTDFLATVQGPRRRVKQ